MNWTFLQRRPALLAMAPAILITGCLNLGNIAHRSADADAYPIVQAAQEAVLGTATDYSIEPTTSSLTQQVIEQAGLWVGTGNEEQPTTGGLPISLTQALALAIENNWTYRTQMESLYLAALSLTEAEHDFSPIFSGAVAARATRTPGAGTVERFGEVSTDFGVTKLFATGARVTVGLSNNFLRIFTGSGGTSADGTLAASIVQPLLRGAGQLVVTVNLTQARREMIYTVRDFVRYRQSFVIDQTNRYYRLLQTRDQVENEWQAYQRVLVSRRRSEAMQQAQRLAAYQVDQARQDEIRARNRWISAQARYVNELNQFKLALGLPVNVNIQPDPAELQRLNEMGLVEIGFTLADAERLALEQRLDYRTAQDLVEDAQRAVKIAENGLLPDLDLRADASVGDGGNNQPFDFEGRTRRYGIGVEMELPLDRLRERNNYRRALINLERRLRDCR